MAKTPTFATARRARQKEVGKKQIQGTIIVTRFCNCLGQPHDVDPDKPLTDLLHGGLVKWDLGLLLNGYTPFRLDGLLLQKRDVMNADTVGELGDLVFKWYRANGWSIR